jgi:hypothetical protein
MFIDLIFQGLILFNLHKNMLLLLIINIFNYKIVHSEDYHILDYNFK